MKPSVARGPLRTLLSLAGVVFVLVGLSTDVRAGGVITPEIDAGSLGSGLALLAAGALLITGRRRKRDEPADSE